MLFKTKRYGVHIVYGSILLVVVLIIGVNNGYTKLMINRNESKKNDIIKDYDVRVKSAVASQEQNYKDLISEVDKLQSDFNRNLVLTGIPYDEIEWNFPSKVNGINAPKIYPNTPLFMTISSMQWHIRINENKNEKLDFNAVNGNFYVIATPYYNDPGFGDFEAPLMMIQVISKYELDELAMKVKLGNATYLKDSKEFKDALIKETPHFYILNVTNYVYPAIEKDMKEIYAFKSNNKHVLDLYVHVKEHIGDYLQVKESGLNE